MNKNIILAVIFLLIRGLSIAQWSSDPMVNTLIADSSGWHITPKVATDPNGNTYVCWFGTVGEELNFYIYLQRFDKQGVKQWSGDLLVSNKPTDTWVSDYNMILDDQGNAIIVNQDYRNGFSNVYAWKISPEGELLWGDDGITVTNDTSGVHVSPDIVKLSSGDFVIKWDVWPQDPTNQLKNYIGLQKISGEGTLLWGNGVLIKDTSHNYLSDFTATSDGGIIAVWDRSQQLGQDTTLGVKHYLHILARKYDLSGNPVWAEPVQADSGEILLVDQGIRPYPEEDHNGGAFILWPSPGVFTVNLLVQHMNDNGTPAWPGFGTAVSTNEENSRSKATMVYDPSASELILTWNEYAYDGSSLTDCWGIYGQKLSWPGERLWGDSALQILPLICSEDTLYETPVVKSAPSGDVMVMIQKEYRAITGPDTILTALIFACRLNAQGNAVWEKKVADVSTSLMEKDFLVSGDSSQSQYIVAWPYRRDHDSISGIAVQNVRLDGNIGPLSIGPPPSGNSPELIVFPNPVDRSATIHYTLKEPSRISISLYDLQERHLRTLIDREKDPPGDYLITLMRTEEETGIYFLKAETGMELSVTKVIFY